MTVGLTLLKDNGLYQRPEVKGYTGYKPLTPREDPYRRGELQDGVLASLLKTHTLTRLYDAQKELQRVNLVYSRAKELGQDLDNSQEEGYSSEEFSEASQKSEAKRS